MRDLTKSNQLDENFEKLGKYGIVGYSPDQVSFVLSEIPCDSSSKIKITEWEGRNAIALPANDIKQIYKK